MEICSKRRDSELESPDAWSSVIRKRLQIQSMMYDNFASFSETVSFDFCEDAFDLPDSQSILCHESLNLKNTHFCQKHRIARIEIFKHPESFSVRFSYIGDEL